MADNQHYISQAHLRQFIHPKSRDKVLYPYAKGGGPQKPRGTARLASAIDFYVQRIAGNANNKLDERRKKAETIIFRSGKSAPGTISQCIYDDKFKLNQEKAGDLAVAAAFLWSGSPLQIHNTAMIALLCNDAHALNTLNTNKAKNQYHKAYGDKADERIDADRDALFSGELTTDAGEDTWKQLGFQSFQLAKMMANALFSMNLTVVDAHGDDFFITSDNPVVTHSPLQSDNPGFRLPDASIWFPISYKRALLWRHGCSIAREVFSTRQTCAKNTLMIKWCYKYVYSPLPDTWIEAAARAETFNPRFGHFQKLGDVINQAAPAFLPGGTPAGEIINIGAVLKRAPQVDALRI